MPILFFDIHGRPGAYRVRIYRKASRMTEKSTPILYGIERFDAMRAATASGRDLLKFARAAQPFTKRCKWCHGWYVDVPAHQQSCLRRGDCDHPRFDENGVCTACKDFYSREHDQHPNDIHPAMARLCRRLENNKRET